LEKKWNPSGAQRSGGKAWLMWIEAGLW
jgi:hypothetical protein